MFSIINYCLLDLQWIDFATTQLDYAAQAVQSNIPVISVGFYVVSAHSAVLENTSTELHTLAFFIFCGDTIFTIVQLPIYDVPLTVQNNNYNTSIYIIL